MSITDDVVFFTNTGRHLLGVSFITSIKSNLHTALTAENTTANNCIILHTQDTTELHTNVFLIGIARFLVTKNGRLSRQGQLQTPQPLSVFFCGVLQFYSKYYQ